METGTNVLLRSRQTTDGYFVVGAMRKDRHIRQHALKLWEEVRALYGLKGHPSLLTKGKANHKLGMAAQYTVGLTLQHYVMKMLTGETINWCPNAGHCTKVCIGDNGKGGLPHVQLVRRARNEFFARHPAEACFLLGWELADEVAKHGPLLFRPNVNSDVEWELILPSLVNGTVFGPDVMSYDYGKDADRILPTNGWLGTHYRVAYSWNEDSDAKAVRAFLQQGGSVAVVTERMKGAPVLSVFPFGTTAYAVDADKTDEWIFRAGTVGDLSAKGRARKLVGKSDFIVRSAA